MSQRKGFWAFFRKIAASETLKSAIAAHTNLEETFLELHLCFQVEGFSSIRIIFCPHHHEDEAPATLKSFEESSQSVKKKRVLIPK